MPSESWMPLMMAGGLGLRAVRLRISVSRWNTDSIPAERVQLEVLPGFYKPLPNDVPIRQYVANYFSGKTHGSKKNNERAKIGSELRRMRADRVSADYDSSMSNMKSLNATVKDVLVRSERVISSLEKGGL